ncbi:MAG: hypothetical protein LBQ93_07885 [Treponema sp.]|jgi:two-component system chemotaxis sensor kinase CheA|nr:hypothetical protein [Treponema sp.]
MAKKEKLDRTKKVGNIISFVVFAFICASYCIETQIANIELDIGFTVFFILLTFSLLTSVINVSSFSKLAFNVPLALLIYYTIFMSLSGWQIAHYFFMCLILCALSCIYSSFSSTVLFIIFQNIIVGFLVWRGTPVDGHGTTFVVTVMDWAITLFASIIMLRLTRRATIVLDRALEHQNSFRDLLDTTENFVAMIDDRNQIVYASKTLSQLSETEEPTLLQGRPLIDLFPGKSLKTYAGKMLEEKDDYVADWESMLNGQKRYFKAISHRLPGGSGGTLISLYDMTHLAERDEIAVMKDSMKIGLFFMDKNYVIQDHYSRYLEEMLSKQNLFGQLFTDVISDSVSKNELTSIKDYFDMILECCYDQEMLDDINPLNELRYVNKETSERKVFQCAFATVERGRGEVFILVTVYDITARVELQEKLAEEEGKRQEEMQSVFELINVAPDVFGDFMEDMEHEFTTIEKTVKNDAMSAHEILVKVYQSVHAIKSNAVIIGLNVFGNKVHALESKIKKLREMEGDVPFAEMLNLAMELEKLSKNRESFKVIIEKLQVYASGSTSGEKQSVKILIESLAKATSRASEDMGKQVKFVASDIDDEAIEKGPRRVMKEVLMQLVRNSVVHGVEEPDVRKAKGKDETGTIKLSIKITEDRKNIQVKLSDDGRGLDYKKIAEKAVNNKLIKKEDANNNDVLMKAIFLPGFSTAETEGVHAGRGIGLNLVRDRVKEINGTLKLRSEPDKGLLFFVSLPFVPQAASQPKPKEKTKAS